MLSFIFWYLIITVVGLLAFPLAYRMLPNLPDRGYALARPLGMLLWGYGLWLLASLQVLQNNTGGILLALALVAGLSVLAMGGQRWNELRSWLREHWRQVATSEILFLALFAIWTVVRSMNPDASGTEKPMELAFINAILRSPVFPPHDPWLSGYAISYYYFGYVMVAMMAKLTAVSSGVAFNLAIAMWFAMTALGAYGILYNLLALQRSSREAGEGKQNLVAGGWALLAPMFLLIVSNLEGFLEMLHARGLFWQGDQSNFWSWINLQELIAPPSSPLTWVPNRPGGIWWWRASRVLSDFNLQGGFKEVIDEFPFFSYLLADLHPHVLAMPFALLAVSLALNFYLFVQQKLLPEMGLGHWFRLWGQENAPSLWSTRLGAWVRTPGFWLAAVVLGGLAFVNTWDFPIYVALFSAAYVLARFQQDGWRFTRLGELLELAAALVVTGAVLYLPFYFGFQSQAGGLLPSLSFFTRGIHLWIMFGSLLIPVILWILMIWARRGSRSALAAGLKFAGIAVFSLWAFSYLLSAIITTLLTNVPRFSALSKLFFDLQGAAGPADLLMGSMLRRLTEPGAWLTLFFLLMVVWGLLYTYQKSQPKIEKTSEEMQEEPGNPEITNSTGSTDAFVLLLALVGTGLVLVPEFFYLRDQFGTRMNTIFKFYFEAWMVWSIAAAYASTMIWQALRSGWRWVARPVWAVILLMALAYPVFGLWYKTDHFRTQNLTLDGNAYLDQYEPDEMTAIAWLRTAPAGVVAEAVGGSYTAYARVSMLSGQPTVLGWPGHENQWRGSGKEIGSRETDIERLYRTGDWNEAAAILRHYNIRYVYVGSLEKSTYRASEGKFQANLRPVYQNKTVTIYEVPDISLLPQAGG